MRNITVSVDEDTHRLARVRAAELDTSISALVREYLRTLSGDDSAENNGARDTAIHQHVRQLYEEARTRAEAVAGRPIRDVQELVEFRRCLLEDVASRFHAEGIGIVMPGIANREEIYDRGRARLEAMLAAAEERGDKLEGDLAALKAGIETTA